MSIPKNIVLAWRQTTRRRHLSFLQMIGITIGVTASLLLCSYINWHYSFDRFHLDLPQLYRVSTIQQEGDAREDNALTPAGLAPTSTENVPEVILSTRVAKWIANDVVLSQQKRVIRDNQLIFAEPSFFQLFSFKTIAGSPSALDEPNTILLTQTKAHALFGDEDPLGKEILFENFKPIQVIGIIEDPPPYSHLQFSSITSFRTLQNWGFDVFSNGQLDIPYVYTYLKLNESADPNLLADRITSLVNDRKQNSPSESQSVSFHLVPVKDLHLFADNINDMISSGQGKGIWTLFGISLLILLISWVNHINIFTASAMQQRKSLSIRKIIGARPGQLFQILFAQSLLTSSLGAIFGVLLATFLKPIFFGVLNIPVHQSTFSWIHWQPSILLLLIILSGTIVFSFLPSFWITNQKTYGLVSPQQNFTPKGIRLRLSLVGIQFAIILTLIIGGIVVFRQAQFMNQKDPGIELENVMSIRSPLGFDATQFDQRYQAFKQHLLSNPSITKVGFSRKIPGDELEYAGAVTIDNRNFEFGFLRNFIEPDFLSVYNLPVVAQVDKSFMEGGRYAFVNRKIVELLGLKNPADILNKTVTIYDWKIEIIGVVENFHQQSLHHPIAPTVMDFSGKQNASVDGYISMKFDNHRSTKYISDWTKKAFDEYFPLTVYESIPVKEFYYDQYSWDQNFQKISISFTILGLFIGCLGLLALSILLIQQRLKEVSIRKVLGASTKSILLLFSRDFLLVILLAMPAAFISAYFLLNRWLEHYAFHVAISWWIYLLAGLIALIVGFLTISSQSILVAKINPVVQLRNV